MTARQFFWFLALHIVSPRRAGAYLRELQSQKLPEIDSSLIPMKERQCS